MLLPKRRERRHVTALHDRNLRHDLTDVKQPPSGSKQSCVLSSKSLACKLPGKGRGPIQQRAFKGGVDDGANSYTACALSVASAGSH